MNMIRCDTEGVPRLVQNIKYHFGGFYFVFTLFTGVRLLMDAGFVKGMGIMTEPEEVTDEQFFQAEIKFLSRYKKYG